MIHRHPLASNEYIRTMKCVEHMLPMGMAAQLKKVLDV